MKTKYNVTIEETVSENFEIEIEAENIYEALKISEQQYKNGEFVLSPGNLVFRQILIRDEKGNCVDWHEF